MCVLAGWYSIVVFTRALGFFFWLGTIHRQEPAYVEYVKYCFVEMGRGRIDVIMELGRYTLDLKIPFKIAHRTVLHFLNSFHLIGGISFEQRKCRKKQIRSDHFCVCAIVSLLRRFISV